MQPVQLAFLLFLAAVLWNLCAAKKKNRPAQPPPPAVGEAETVLERFALHSCTIETLGEVIDLLCQVMAHPDLGGPGFLLLQLPQSPSVDNVPVISAQYPNINEVLYRRIVRQELADLPEAGLPAQLLAYRPAFATESGGVVQISVALHNLDPALIQLLGGRETRSAALAMLASALHDRCPALSVRRFGPDLLLERSRMEADTSGQVR